MYERLSVSHLEVFKPSPPLLSWAVNFIKHRPFFFFGCAGSMLLYLGFLCGDRGLLFVAVIRLLKDGSSCCRAWALGAQASVVAAHRGSAALQHLPGPGIEPKYPASPGKSQAQAFGSSLRFQESGT